MEYVICLDILAKVASTNLFTQIVDLPLLIEEQRIKAPTDAWHIVTTQPGCDSFFESVDLRDLITVFRF